MAAAPTEAAIAAASSSSSSHQHHHHHHHHHHNQHQPHQHHSHHGHNTHHVHHSHHGHARARSLTIVLKLGTSSILNIDTLTPRLSLLSSIVETCHSLRLAGHKVVIVCSGAIGIGRMRMSVTQKPASLGERQALAALGQLRLMALWDNLFNQVGIPVAQVLLTRNDIADRPRYLNAQTTLHTLLDTYDSIPIVNENDTVSVSELRFGDNDTLSAITAGLVDADYLFLCTDVDGLYTGNPRTNENARRLGIVKSVQEARKAVSVETPGTSFGTGGMATKLIAAELATAAGVATVIISSDRPSDILAVVARGIPTSEPTIASTATNTTTVSPNGSADEDSVALLTSSISSLTSEESALIGHPPLSSPPHTLFLPLPTPLPSRKWSVLHALHPTGAIIVDEGAHRRITRPDSGGRLLPAGVLGIKGYWERMQAVRLVVRRRAATATTSAGAGGQAAAPPGSGIASSGTTTPILDTAAAPTILATASSSGDDGGDAPLYADEEFGRCLANYTSEEVDKIKGLRSTEITKVLGFTDSEYVTDTVVVLLAVPGAEGRGV